MRRWLSLACILLAVSAQAQPAPQQKLSTTQKALATSKEEADRLARELSTTQDVLEDLQDRATRLAATLQQSEARANAAERKLRTLDGELAAKEREVRARETEYASTLASMLRMRQLPPTALFAGNDTDRLLRTASVMEHTNAALKDRATLLRKDMEELKFLRSNVAKGQQRVASERKNLAAQQKELGGEVSERQRAQEKLSRDHAAAKARVANLSRESSNLQELITKLERDRNRPQVASRTTKPLGSVRRGNMKLPVAGSVLHRFGERKSANETYRGLVLSGRSGGTVVAPAAGEVVFTGPFRDYGRMVLLKHKDGYISLLAGLGNISVGLNQQMQGGEPLGTLAATPSPTLYVELRQASKPIDPSGWFANLSPSLAKR